MSTPAGSTRSAGCGLCGERGAPEGVLRCRASRRLPVGSCAWWWCAASRRGCRLEDKGRHWRSCPHVHRPQFNAPSPVGKSHRVAYSGISTGELLALLADFVYRGLNSTHQRQWIPGFGVTGAVALTTGLHMIFTWAVPGSFNIAFGETTVLFGVLLVGAAIALAP